MNRHQIIINRIKQFLSFLHPPTQQRGDPKTLLTDIFTRHNNTRARAVGLIGIFGAEFNAAKNIVRHVIKTENIKRGKIVH